MEAVRLIRKDRGWSQERTAAEASIDRVTLVNIETGKSSPTVETLEKLARALAVEVADFFPKAQSTLFPPDDSPIRGFAVALAGEPQEASDLTSAGVAVPADAVAEAQEESSDAALGLSELDHDELAATVHLRKAEYRAIMRSPAGRPDPAMLRAARGRYVRALAAQVEQQAVGDNVEPVLRQALSEALQTAEEAAQESRAG